MRLMRSLLLVVAAGLTACGSSTGSSGSTAPHVLTVVTTTTQLTDFAENVGGDHVMVYAVLKANIDPHDYEPSPAETSTRWPRPT